MNAASNIINKIKTIIKNNKLFDKYEKDILYAIEINDWNEEDIKMFKKNNVLYIKPKNNNLNCITISNNSIYIGELDENNLRTGVAGREMNEKYEYLGRWDNDKPQGQGLYKFMNCKIKCNLAVGVDNGYIQSGSAKCLDDYGKELGACFIPKNFNPLKENLPNIKYRINNKFMDKVLDDYSQWESYEYMYDKYLSSIIDDIENNNKNIPIQMDNHRLVMMDKNIVFGEKDICIGCLNNIKSKHGVKIHKNVIIDGNWSKDMVKSTDEKPVTYHFFSNDPKCNLSMICDHVQNNLILKKSKVKIIYNGKTYDDFKLNKDEFIFEQNLNDMLKKQLIPFIETKTKTKINNEEEKDDIIESFKSNYLKNNFKDNTKLPRISNLENSIKLLTFIMFPDGKYDKNNFYYDNKTKDFYIGCNSDNNFTGVCFKSNGDVYYYLDGVKNGTWIMGTGINKFLNLLNNMSGLEFNNNNNDKIKSQTRGQFVKNLLNSKIIKSLGWVDRGRAERLINRLGDVKNKEGQSHCFC